MEGAAYYLLSQDCPKCGFSCKEKSIRNLDEMTSDERRDWLRCRRCGAWAYAGAKSVYKR